MPALRAQSCSAVLMVRPVGFRANPQTLDSNAFQTPGMAGEAVAAAAAREFESLATALRSSGVTVHAAAGRAQPEAPDQLFPNNWLSLHEDGTVVLYPMAAPNRRHERRLDLIAPLVREHGYQARRLIDLTGYEAAGRYLEGTGSLVFDHREGIAYACRSARTDAEVARDLCLRLGYEPVFFHAVDAAGRAVYHTNVMMSLGEAFAVVCLEAIPDPAERQGVHAGLRASGREVLEITQEQMRRFAANLLELVAADGARVIVLSAAARLALRGEQIRRLLAHARLLPVAVPTIEAGGGGSVRCMLAEIFLPREAADAAA